MKAPTHVVFQTWTVTVGNANGQRVVTVGVWIDLDELSHMVAAAAQNKSKKCKDGALNVEVHTIREVEG